MAFYGSGVFTICNAPKESNNPAIRFFPVREENGRRTPAMVTFRGVTSSKRKDSEGRYTSDYFECTAYGATAEFIQKNFQPGNRILLQGRAEHYTFQIRNADGSETSRTRDRIIAENAEFVERKDPTQQAPASAPAKQYGAPAPSPQYGAPAPVPQYGTPAPAPQPAPAQAPQYGTPAPAPAPQPAPAQAPQYGTPAPAPAPQYGAPTPQPAPANPYGAAGYNAGGDGFMNIPDGIEDSLPFT